ncbi:hypothetical protein [Actinomadura rupiterrae]|uniref:hypothetical protein n=1 Tax=Actinomadura rupiterrae TaxID=559627 RepID=UPI0020A5190D|nr:hypothetical protein [Actinomadura rupiterrae]MCP2335004.1 hypothetical protein [Actinomadura rupiterrae]
MRRIATVAITSGALVAGLLATGGNAFADDAQTFKGSGAAPKAADVSLAKGDVQAQGGHAFTLKYSGLAATSAWGSYWWGRYKYKGRYYRTRVVDGYVRDNKRGLNSCMEVVFYAAKGQHLNPDVEVIYNRTGKGTTARRAIQSFNIGKMYMRECEGYPTSRGFHISHAGSWRVFS